MRDEAEACEGHVGARCGDGKEVGGRMRGEGGGWEEEWG